MTSSTIDPTGQSLPTDIVQGLSRPLAIYLDFDGTISELVEHHADAEVYAGVRHSLDTLKGFCRIAVISGRDPEDVRDRLAIQDIAYAGNHGLRIIRADNSLFEVPHRAEAGLDAVGTVLEKIAERFDGAHVEVKNTARVMHFRKVDPALHGELISALDEAVGEFHDLAMKTGKMVREIQPRVHWHKGYAIRWLNEEAADTIQFTMFIGDDVTDEDAFRVLGDGSHQMSGCGILVADEDRSTAAQFRLTDVQAVATFLSRLAACFDNRARNSL